MWFGFLFLFFSKKEQFLTSRPVKSQTKGSKITDLNPFKRDLRSTPRRRLEENASRQTKMAAAAFSFIHCLSSLKLCFGLFFFLFCFVLFFNHGLIFFSAQPPIFSASNYIANLCVLSGKVTCVYGWLQRHASRLTANTHAADRRRPHLGVEGGGPFVQEWESKHENMKTTTSDSYLLQEGTFDLQHQRDGDNNPPLKSDIFVFLPLILIRNN